jgi:uncharacterized membrane protein YcaP (DUF421 family)
MTQIVPRAAILFLVLWGVTRGMGRKELAQLSAFELLLLIVMGDLIQQGITLEDQSLTGALLAVGTFALFILLFSTASFRWPRTRSWIDGQPVLVIEDGRPLRKVLALQRLTLEEVKEAARQQGIADLAQVRFGVLEVNGKFSFVRFDGLEPQGEEEQITT